MAPKPQVVLMAQGNGDAEAISSTLNDAGFAVVSCNVIALPERVTRVAPFGVVIDMTETHVDVVLKELSEQQNEQPGDGIAIAALGSQHAARELGLSESDRVRIFDRPIQPEAIADYFLNLTGTEAPPLASTSPRDSDSHELSEFPAIAGMAEMEGIMPELDGAASTSAAKQLSPEIEALLQAGAERVNELKPAAAPVTHETNIPVPSDMLALVDDLLAPDDVPATRGVASPPATTGRGMITPSSDPQPASSATDNVPTSTSRHSSEAPGGTTQSGVGEKTNVPRTQVGEHNGQSSAPATTHDDARTSNRPASSQPTHGVAQPHATLGSSPAGAVSAVQSDRHVRQTPYPLSPSAIPDRPHHGAEASPSETGSESRNKDAPSDSAPLTQAHQMAFSSALPRTPVGPQASPIQPPLKPPGTSDPIDSTREQDGEPLYQLAHAVQARMTGALLMGSADGTRVRRILMRDGDMVNAASDTRPDALVEFLVERGDLSPEVATLRSMKLPLTGRHAAAALIANGFLSQDDLWPVLRAHAEWIICKALREKSSRSRLEREPPERLQAEPNVFGGATGVEIFIDSVRRVFTPEDALHRLGGSDAMLSAGTNAALLAESALLADEAELLRAAPGLTAGQVLAPKGPKFAPVLLALDALQIIKSQPRDGRPSPAAVAELDPLDADAVRERIRARMILVQEADYFALLGITPNATSYDIRRAYIELRRRFEPSRLLTAATADLNADVEIILDVLEEAYSILRDPQRRNRYRHAIQAAPRL